MRITIAFPSYPTSPVGGFKVVYEYANRLVARGHVVTLIHPRTVEPSTVRLDRLKAYLWPQKVRLLNRGSAPAWFCLDPCIVLRLPRSLSACRAPDGDILMATGWRTAPWVASQSAAKGEKFYFVQDYEYWAHATPALKEEIGNTFRLPLRHIAISSVVKSMLEECGARADAVIRSGIDHDVFYLSEPINARQPDAIAFPLRSEPFKATGDAVVALERARALLDGSLQVLGYGAAVPDQLPDWIQAVRRPSDRELRALLNSVAIFVLPSHYEGWGLTGLEAMACGAALITADSGGVRDYARDGDTAIVVPPGRPDLIARALIKLIRDPARRREIASRGRAFSRKFAWDAAVNALESSLLSYSS